LHRVVGVMAAAALVVALTSAVARASLMASSPQRLDVGSQLMLQLFGEISDSNASFAAAHGDRSSESPLRDLVLQIHSADSKSYLGLGAAPFAEDRLAWRDLSDDVSYFSPGTQTEASRIGVRLSPLSHPGDDVVSILPPSGLFTAAYQPVAPEPNISPAPGTLAFALPQAHVPSFPAATTQLGALRFEGQQAASTGSQQISLHNAFSQADATLEVRAGRRDVNLNLTSEYAHLGGNDTEMLSAPTLDTSAWQLPGAPLVVPSSADLSRLSLGAGLSVPVVRGLTLNLNYAAQRLNGDYGLPGLLNLDTINDTYGGGLTFTIPQISSSLSISAYQNRFEESPLSINGSTQTHEDVNFTVKF
jgi:hypothetical protein